jgi:hypothetical protein
MRSALLGANGYVKCLAYLADIAISFSASFRQADKLDRRRDRKFPIAESEAVFSLAIVPVRRVDRNVAGRGVGRSGDKGDLDIAHKRRVSLRNCAISP